MSYSYRKRASSTSKRRGVSKTTKTGSSRGVRVPWNRSGTPAGVSPNGYYDSRKVWHPLPSNTYLARKPKKRR